LVDNAPLLLLDLAPLVLPNWRRNAGFITGLIALDVFTILTGLLAGQSTAEFARGFWFMVSTAAMVALLYPVYTRLFASAQGQPGSVQSIFRTLALLTIVPRSLYPIVWLLGTEGFGAVSSTDEVFLFLVLDILAKVGFGFLLLTNREQGPLEPGALSTRTAGLRAEPRRFLRPRSDDPLETVSDVR